MRKAQLLKSVGGILLFLIPLYSARFNQELPAKDIIKKADDNVPGKTSQTDLTIKTIRPPWSREINMKACTKWDDYSMISVTSPAKKKETVFLKRFKEFWNWISTISKAIVNYRL